MPRLLKIAALLLVAIWLPATVHCRLEGLGFDTLFGCSDHSDSAEHSSSAECDDDGCQVLEDGQFSMAKSRVDFALPAVLAAACHPCLFHVGPPAPAPAIFATGQDAALPLQRTWQFVRRAAPLARAPDLNT